MNPDKKSIFLPLLCACVLLIAACGAPPESPPPPTEVPAPPTLLPPTSAGEPAPTPASPPPTALPQATPPSTATLTPVGVHPEELVLRPSDVPADFRLVVVYPVTNEEVARRFGDSEARLQILQEQGREMGHYALMEPQETSAHGLASVESTVVRYSTDPGAAAGFELNAATITQVLPHFQPVDAPRLGDEARSWRYEIDDATVLYEVMFRLRNYVFDLMITGNADAVNDDLAADYAQRLRSKLN